MPIYTFENTKTGEVFDEMMMIAEKEVYLKKNKHIRQMLTTINISKSGVMGHGQMKSDNGWKEMQSRIAEAHPISPFADQHGKIMDGKKCKVELQKHIQPPNLHNNMVNELLKKLKLRP